MSEIKIRCEVGNANTFCRWFENRGGVALWESIDLSQAGATCCTPANATDGTPTGKPGYQWDNAPVKIETDPSKVEVYSGREVHRFHVGLRRGAQGFKIKLTDASSRRLRERLARWEEKLGKPTYYRFDYETQDAVIFVEEVVGNLRSWAQKNRHYGFLKQPDGFQLFAADPTAQQLIFGWGSGQKQVEADCYGSAQQNDGFNLVKDQLLIVPSKDRRDLVWHWNFKKENAEYLLQSYAGYKPEEQLGLTLDTQEQVEEEKKVLPELLALLREIVAGTI